MTNIFTARLPTTHGGTAKTARTVANVGKGSKSVAEKERSRMRYWEKKSKRDEALTQRDSTREDSVGPPQDINTPQASIKMAKMGIAPTHGGQHQRNMQPAYEYSDASQGAQPDAAGGYGQNMPIQGGGASRMSLPPNDPYGRVAQMHGQNAGPRMASFPAAADQMRRYPQPQGQIQQPQPGYPGQRYGAYSDGGQAPQPWEYGQHPSYSPPQQRRAGRPPKSSYMQSTAMRPPVARSASNASGYVSPSPPPVMAVSKPDILDSLLVMDTNGSFKLTLNTRVSRMLNEDGYEGPLGTIAHSFTVPTDVTKLVIRPVLVPKLREVPNQVGVAVYCNEKRCGQTDSAANFTDDISRGEEQAAALAEKRSIFADAVRQTNGTGNKADEGYFASFDVPLKKSMMNCINIWTAAKTANTGGQAGQPMNTQQYLIFVTRA